MSKKILKGIGKDAGIFVGTSIGLSVGSSVIQKTGGSTSGIETFSSFMPMAATASMGGRLIGATQNLLPKKKKGKKKKIY